MAIAVLLIIAIGLVFFVTEWVPLPVTAMSMCVAFYLVGAVDASTALNAFASSTAMIIVCMAIIGEAVFKTGGAAKIGNVLTKFAGSEKKLIFVTVIFAGLMSGFLSNTGAADMIASAAQSVFTSVGSPMLILILIFLFITPLTNFMSNAATIILFTPIALLISEALGINPKAILTAVRFAASIAIATPVAMPANSMAVEPGGYRFMDYVRPGILLTLICVVVSIGYIAIFYPLG